MIHNNSDQERIWDHFQNEGIKSFSQSKGRLEFLANKLKPGTQALNIGVGSGALEELAVAKGVDIWSLDPNERAVTRLRDLLNMSDKAQTGYSQSIPFPDSTFDVVIMSEVLEHLEDEALHATLREVRRVLRKDGLFIGTVPARENMEESLVVCPCCGAHFHRWGHKQRFDIERLSRLLATQFSTKEIFEHFFIEWSSASLKKKISGLLKQLLSWKGIGTYGANRSIFFSAKNR